jgi:hypothetical protein
MINLGSSNDLSSLSFDAFTIVYKPQFGFEMNKNKISKNKIKSQKIRGSKKLIQFHVNTYRSMSNKNPFYN